MRSFKEYVNTFSKPKKMFFIISCVLFFFEALAPVCYLIDIAFIDITAVKTNAFSIIWYSYVLAFNYLEVFKIYLFIFPIVFLLLHSLILYKHKYCTIIIVLDYIFQIVNPLTITFIICIVLSIFDSNYQIL